MTLQKLSTDSQEIRLLREILKQLDRLTKIMGVVANNVTTTTTTTTTAV